MWRSVSELTPNFPFGSSVKCGTLCLTSSIQDLSDHLHLCALRKRTRSSLVLCILDIGVHSTNVVRRSMKHATVKNTLSTLWESFHSILLPFRYSRTSNSFLICTITAEQFSLGFNPIQILLFLSMANIANKK